MRNQFIYPGKPWFDTEGKRIQAHGAGVLYEDGIFYWYGENKEFTDGKNAQIWTWGIRMYSSSDLVNWKDEGLVIKPEPNEKKSVLNPRRKMDRPHLLKCPSTGKYVMWVKFIDISHFAVFTADDIHGPYTIVEDHYAPNGLKPGDFDIDADPETGKAYLFVEDDHKRVVAFELNDDYCGIHGAPAIIYQGLNPPFSREGVTHIARGGKHYIVTSGMTGYVPNPSEVAVADDWMGPYVVQGNPHVDDLTDASFNSQISYIFKHPEKKDLYISVADRWLPEYPMDAEKVDWLKRTIGSNFDRTLKASFSEKMKMIFSSPVSPFAKPANTSIADYVWLPLRFEGDRLLIDWKDAWSPDEYEEK